MPLNRHLQPTVINTLIILFEIMTEAEAEWERKIESELLKPDKNDGLIDFYKGRLAELELKRKE